MNSYNIAVIPGDGTGPEMVREGLKVLQGAAQKYNFKLNLKPSIMERALPAHG